MPEGLQTFSAGSALCLGCEQELCSSPCLLRASFLASMELAGANLAVNTSFSCPLTRLGPQTMKPHLACWHSSAGLDKGLNGRDKGTRCFPAQSFLA